MKTPKLKIKNFKTFFKKLPRISGERAFLTFLVFLFLALIFGAFTFYKYGILIGREKPEALEKPLQFQEKTYQNVLKIWQEKEKRFNEADSKTYPDLFKVD